jgi:hypothetical protein
MVNFGDAEKMTKKELPLENTQARLSALNALKFLYLTSNTGKNQIAPLAHENRALKAKFGESSQVGEQLR